MNVFLFNLEKRTCEKLEIDILYNPKKDILNAEELGETIFKNKGYEVYRPSSRKQTLFLNQISPRKKEIFDYLKILGFSNNCSELLMNGVPDLLVVKFNINKISELFMVEIKGPFDTVKTSQIDWYCRTSIPVFIMWFNEL